MRKWVLFLQGGEPKWDPEFEVDIEREGDGRWIAEVVRLPGALVYGETEEAAILAAGKLALQIVGDRQKSGEPVPGDLYRWPLWTPEEIAELDEPLGMSVEEVIRLLEEADGV